MPKTIKKTKEKEEDKKETKKTVVAKTKQTKSKPKSKKTVKKSETKEKKESAIKKESKETKNVTETEDAATKKLAYYYAIGRRKSAVAQVRLYKKGEGEIKINEKDIKNYFPREEWQVILSAPLKAMGQTNKLNIFIKIQGGGVKSQAEAARLGISRALLKLNPIFKRGLKKYGYLTRDSRVKERKKYGLRGARRAPQWAKR